MFVVRHRAVVALTLGQARVLFTPEMAEGLFGFDLASLSQEDRVPLLEALGGHGGNAAEWCSRLEGVCVAVLDVNTVPVETLLRIPDLSTDEAQTLVDGRPYLSLEGLRQEGSDLASIAERLAPYVGHDGYLFVDKPAGRIVCFDVDLAAGLLVKQHSDTDTSVFSENLELAGLQRITGNDEEMLFLCHWKVDVPPVERPARLRELKKSEAVVSVAPLLRDRRRHLRVPYPDRLDVMLTHGDNEAAWSRLNWTYGLTTVEQYLPHYRSLRVAAQLHDLGALYRVLRALANDAAVRFVEPTYIVT